MAALACVVRRTFDDEFEFDRQNPGQFAVGPADGSLKFLDQFHHRTPDMELPAGVMQLRLPFGPNADGGVVRVDAYQLGKLVEDGDDVVRNAGTAEIEM